MLSRLVICCATVLVFDAIAATLSRVAAITYAWFTIPQLAMYAIMGFVLFRRFGTDKRLFIVLVTAAVCEATIGWWLSALIGPGRPLENNIVALAISALFVVCINTGVGWLGSLAARRVFSP